MSPLQAILVNRLDNLLQQVRESLHHIFIFVVKAIAEQILIHISYQMY
jgi:hypothetical protein